MRKAKIAVMLDENTSKGGGSYDLSKNYMNAIIKAGGIPYGIPYCEDFIENAVQEFDGFFSVGGAVALPSEWYEVGHRSPFPVSERTAIEIGIMKSFLKANKPVLGSCNGMQILAGLHGCKMNVGLDKKHQNNHDVQLVAGTNFAALMGTFTLAVNSRHSEHIVAPTDRVTVYALSDDGIIEAIEIPDRKFALGLQWHQEDFWNKHHPGNKVFAEFIRLSLT